MRYFSAIPHHADRFASENTFQDGARATCQIGGANALHFHTSPQEIHNNMYKYILFGFSAKERCGPITYAERKT
jgi:hypothetical protein